MEAFKSANAALSAATERAKTSSDDVAALDRLRSIIGYVREKVRSADPLLVPAGALDPYPQQLSQISAELANYTGSGNPQHLINANSYADPLLSWSGSLALRRVPEDFHAATESLVGFRSDVESLLRALEARTQSIQSQLAAVGTARDELLDQLRATRSEVASLSAEYQRQFSEGQERRGNDFLQAQQERDRSFRESQDVARTTLSDLLSTKQEEWRVFSERVDSEWSDASARFVAGFESQLASTATNFEAQELLLDKRVKEAERIVGLLAGRAVVSSYQKSANYFRWVGWGWNIVTVAAIGGLVAAVLHFLGSGAVGATAGPLNAQSTVWARLSGELPLFLALGALATYAGFEAAKAQRAEIENRKLELDLAALGPFLAGLDDTELNKFRLKIADRVFGKPFDPDSVQASPATLTGALARSTRSDKFVFGLIDHLVKALKE